MRVGMVASGALRTNRIGTEVRILKKLRNWATLDANARWLTIAAGYSHRHLSRIPVRGVARTQGYLRMGIRWQGQPIVSRRDGTHPVRPTRSADCPHKYRHPGHLPNALDGSVGLPSFGLESQLTCASEYANEPDSSKAMLR